MIILTQFWFLFRNETDSDLLRTSYREAGSEHGQLSLSSDSDIM